MRTRLLWSTHGAVAAIAVATPSLAQTVTPPTPAAPAGQSQSQLEAAGTDAQDIIVTAQRRSENLRDVPISIQAFSADQLAQAGVGSVGGLPALTPSVNISTHLTPYQSSIRIRGVGTNVSSPFAEPSVSMVVDGVVIARQASFFTDLVDIQQVEVLRGPQSTLFGKNAVAGVVNITTAQPNLTRVEGIGEAGVNSYGDTTLRGTVSVPLSPTLGIRVTGSLSRNGVSNIRNVNPTGPSLNGGGDEGVRAKLFWEPGKGVNFTLIGDWRHEDEPNTVRVPVKVESLAVQNLYGVGPVSDRTREVDLDGGPFDEHFHRDTDWGVSLTGNAPIGALTLTSVTAYRRYTLRSSLDADETGLGYTPAGYDDPVVVPGVGSVDPSRFPLFGPTQVFGQLRSTQFSQEVRLTSPGTGRFRWLVGGFYWHTTAYFDNRETLRTCPLDTAAPGFTAPPPRPVIGDGDPNALTGRCTFPAPNGAYIEFRTIYDVRSDYLAGFGQGDLDVGRFTLTLGGRVQRDHFSYSVAGGLGGDLAIPGATVSVAPFSGSSDRVRTIFTGKSSIRYKLTATDNLYISYSRGYKGPGLDSAANPATFPLALNPETVNAYEAGYKARLFDGLVTLDAALYWQDFKNLQQVAYNTQLAQLTAINAGAARQRGVEVDSSLRATPRLSLSAGLVFLDAIYTDFTNSDCPTPRATPSGCTFIPVAGAPARAVRDVTGLPVIYSPKWSYNLTANYRFPLLGQSAQLGATYRFVDRQQTQATETPDGILPAYGILDLRFGVQLAHSALSVSAYVNNVFDKSYGVFAGVYNYSGQVNPLNPNTVTWVIPKDAERTFGMVVRAKF